MGTPQHYIKIQALLESLLTELDTHNIIPHFLYISHTTSLIQYMNGASAPIYK